MGLGLAGLYMLRLEFILELKLYRKSFKIPVHLDSFMRSFVKACSNRIHFLWSRGRVPCSFLDLVLISFNVNSQSTTIINFVNSIVIGR